MLASTIQFSHNTHTNNHHTTTEARQPSAQPHRDKTHTTRVSSQTPNSAPTHSQKNSLHNHTHPADGNHNQHHTLASRAIHPQQKNNKATHTNTMQMTRENKTP